VAVPTHFRFTVRGVFVGTPETWSFGMHFSRDNPAGSDAQINNIDVDQVTGAIYTFFGAIDSKIPQNCEVSDWRMYVIGTNNRLEGNPLVEDVSASHIKGQGTVAYPPQIAIKVTTVGANRGPGKFGGFYLPTMMPVVSTDLRVTAQNATNLAESCSTFMKSVSNQIDLEGPLQSSAGLNISQSGPAGARQEIDHIEVGRVLDTLRNRRKSMVEDRVSTGHIDW
jgi:hypothetical protein